MSLKLRLARAGAKKRPFYRIVVADSRSPRDGRFIEIVGTYNPILPKTDEKRVIIETERIQHWLKVGAQPTDRVLRFLDAAGLAKRAPRSNPEKAQARQEGAGARCRRRAARRGARRDAGRRLSPTDRCRQRQSDRVVVAHIGAAHGIKGEVRVKSFTARPADIAAYGPLEAADGRRFEIAALRPAAGTSPDMLVVRFAGIDDRNRAETLNGLELSVPRDRLPLAAEDEFYHADLIGLAAATPDGATLGTVIAVQNYGAGDLLEIAPPRGETLLVPFTRAAVPEVDLVARRVVVDLPPRAGSTDRTSKS